MRAGGWICALPLDVVIETMRALPVRPIAGAPSFVRGIATVRGAQRPVLELSALLGAGSGGRGGRLVSVRSGEGQVSIEVDEVLGVRHLDEGSLERTAPLLSEAVPACVERLGSLDGQTLAVLGAARLVPEEVWAAIGGGG